MDWKPRVIDPEELDRVVDISATVFGAGPVAPENYRKEVRTVTEVDRTFAIDDGPTIVATGGILTFDIALPGTTLPIAGVTEVGVLPTHRRRGILTAIMTALFDQAVEREEPLAGLTASEGAIYRRYGYGVGARFHTVVVDTLQTAEIVDKPVGGQMRLVAEADAATLLPEAWAKHWPGSPGEVNRNPAWWEMLAIDPDDDRDGASARYLAVHEDAAGAVDGFASYRLKDGGAPDGYYFELQVNDLAAADDDVQAALLRYLFEVDLVRQLRWRSAPVDLTLRWRLAEPRAVKVTQERDHLWLRVLDVARCLSARSYLGEGGGVIEVVDPRRPDVGGTFALDVGPDGADCVLASVSPDVRVGIAELGALLAGGVGWRSLQRAGVVEELTTGAVDRLDAVFRPARAPYCATGF